MASELRINKIKSQSGVGGTISIENHGQQISGITTIESLSLGNPFIEMGQSITSNYSIGESTNALTAGPVGVATGYTVTVPSGSVWIIV